MDVCQFTSEQREELIEDLLALKDAVPVEETCPSQRKKRILHSVAGNKCTLVVSK